MVRCKFSSDQFKSEYMVRYKFPYSSGSKKYFDFGISNSESNILTIFIGHKIIIIFERL